MLKGGAEGSLGSKIVSRRLEALERAQWVLWVCYSVGEQY